VAAALRTVRREHAHRPSLDPLELRGPDTSAWDVLTNVPTWVLALLAGGMWLAVAVYMLHWGRTWDLDLRVYRAAIHALHSGAGPYESELTSNRLRFTYPPFALLVMSPVGLGPQAVVEVFWWLLDAVALTGICYIGLTEVRAVRGGRAIACAASFSGAAVLLLEPVRSNMDYGQVDVLLIFLVLFDLLRVRRSRRGALVGIAGAIKLTPLLFLTLFVVRRDPKSLGRGLLSFGVSTVVGYVLLPSESRYFWAHVMSDTRRIGPLGYVSNQSWAGLLHRSPFHGGALSVGLWLLLVSLTMTLGVMLAASLVRSGRHVASIFGLALVALLVSPISWTHTWSWLVLVPILLFEEPRLGLGVRCLMITVVSLAVTSPYWWLTEGWPGIVAGDSLVVSGAVLMATWTITERRRVQGDDPPSCEQVEQRPGVIVGSGM
jgi:alpha-1,2-mannosyltransferase